MNENEDALIGLLNDPEINDPHIGSLLKQVSHNHEAQDTWVDAQHVQDEVQYAQDEAQYAQDEAQYAPDEAQYTQDDVQYAQDEAQYAQDEAQYAPDEAQYAPDEAQYAPDEAQYVPDDAQYAQQDDVQYAQDDVQYAQQDDVQYVQQDANHYGSGYEDRPANPITTRLNPVRPSGFMPVTFRIGQTRPGVSVAPAQQPVHFRQNPVPVPVQPVPVPVQQHPVRQQPSVKENRERHMVRKKTRRTPYGVVQQLVKVFTLNLSRNDENVGKVLHLIKRLTPDLVCLQEVTSDMYNSIKSRCVAYKIFQIFIEEGNSYGTCILCSRDTTEVVEPYYYDYPESQMGRRLVGCEIQYKSKNGPPQNLHILTTHLESLKENAAYRNAQLGVITEATKTLDNVILAGDLNIYSVSERANSSLFVSKFLDLWRETGMADMNDGECQPRRSARIYFRSKKTLLPQSLEIPHVPGLELEHIALIGTFELKTQPTL